MREFKPIQVMNRRTEIRIEGHRFLRIRERSGSIRRCCNRCGPTAPLISPAAAAALARTSERTINRWVEMETIHFAETSDGRLYVCALSVREFASDASSIEPG